jgi:transposase
MRAEHARLSRHAPIAQAIDYMLMRWPAFTRFLDDGRICLSNNAAERALRGVAKARSLCPPCSSLWKHWELIFDIDATRATCSRKRCSSPFISYVGGSDLVWRSWYDLLGGQRAVLDQPPNAVTADAERCCGLGHRQLLAALLRRTVGMNAINPAH